MIKSAAFAFQTERGSSKWVLFILGLFTIVLFLILTLLNQTLINPSAPQGIISYELADSFRQSQNILGSWSPPAKIIAAFSLGIDYLFLALYSLFLALSCYLLAIKFKNRFAAHRLGIILAWAQILAGILDAVENYGLFRLLLSSQNEFYTTLAFYCATVKFALIFAGLIYIIVAIIIAVLNGLREK